MVWSELLTPLSGAAVMAWALNETNASTAAVEASKARLLIIELSRVEFEQTGESTTRAARWQPAGWAGLWLAAIAAGSASDLFRARGNDHSSTELLRGFNESRERVPSVRVRLEPAQDATETIMLALRPNCECCDKDLPPQAADAMICTFECTFCPDCTEMLEHVCPNCGGELVPRPRRKA